MTAGSAQDRRWTVYMILCSDASYYTGITTDVRRRLRQHIEGKGAKYFRATRPRRLAFLEEGHSRSSATRRELALKKLSHSEKRRLVAEFLSSTAATTLNGMPDCLE